jgi:hypothetical protein
MKEDKMDEACGPHWKVGVVARKTSKLFKKNGWEGMDWIHIAQSKVHSADPSGRAV